MEVRTRRKTHPTTAICHEPSLAELMPISDIIFHDFTYTATFLKLTPTFSFVSVTAHSALPSYLTLACAPIAFTSMTLWAAQTSA